MAISLKIPTPMTDGEETAQTCVKACYRQLTYRCIILNVSRTRRDLNQTGNIILELVRTNNGTFDLYLNGKLDRTSIPEPRRALRFG